MFNRHKKRKPVLLPKILNLREQYWTYRHRWHRKVRTSDLLIKKDKNIYKITKNSRINLNQPKNKALCISKTWNLKKDLSTLKIIYHMLSHKNWEYFLKPTDKIDKEK